MIDVFKIGVAIGMTNNVSQVLGVIQRDLFGLNKTVDLTIGRFNAMKLAAIGAMTAIAGGAALASMAKLAELGGEVLHQQQLMRIAGMSGAQTREATAAAWRTTHDVRGTSIVENLRSIRELRQVFGSDEEAITNLPYLAKSQFVLNQLLGHDAGNQVFDIAKALEIKGVSMDPAHFTALTDMMVKAMIASGGRVTGSDFLSAFKYGRSATQGWNDEFVATILPTLLQEMKGGGSFSGTTGPGNALMTAFAEVVGGQMSNKAAEEFLRLHLVNQSGVIYTSTGHVKGLRPGAVAGANIFQSNPYEWAQEFLLPALRKAGVKGNDKTREEVAHLFGNRTSQQIMDMFLMQQRRFEKDATLDRAAKGVNASYSQLVNHDLMANWAIFTAEIGNLLRALGTPLAKQAVGLLQRLNNVIVSVTDWAYTHQGAVKIIGDVVTALGGLAVALGAFAVGSAAASALGILTGANGFLALGVGLAALAAGLDKMPAWIRAFVRTSADVAAAAAVGGKYGGVPGAVVGGATMLGLDTGGNPFANPFSATDDKAAAAADAKYGKGNWHWGWSWLWGDVPMQGAAPSASSSHAPIPVYLTNPDDVGHATAAGITRGVQHHATHAPTTPTPNAFTWGPGLGLIAP